MDNSDKAIENPKTKIMDNQRKSWELRTVMGTSKKPFKIRKLIMEHQEIHGKSEKSWNIRKRHWKSGKFEKQLNI